MTKILLTRSNPKGIYTSKRLEPVLFSGTGFIHLFKIRTGFKPNLIKPVLTGQPVINKTAKPVFNLVGNNF